MKQTLYWVLFISLSLLHTTTSTVDQGLKTSLITFLAKLNGSTGQPDPSFGWTNSTDPCLDHWKGITCDSQTNTSITRIHLNQSALSGTFDASSICSSQPLINSLQMIKLDLNNIGGSIPAEIANCKNLKRLHLGWNRFVGSVPASLANLTNLERLDLSYNKLTGNVPDVSCLAGLSMFLVQYNQLCGQIPNFDLTRFEYFNVSFNNFSGPIPEKLGRFGETSFLGNPGLCGPILKRKCLSSENPGGNDKNSKFNTKDQLLLYIGYGAVGFVVICVFLYILWKRNNRRGVKDDSTTKGRSFDTGTSKPSSDYNASKLELSSNGAESPMVSTSLVVLTSPQANGLRFNDLLRAPAELIGRGNHGSLYRVIYGNGMVLAVKRIKNWAICCSKFKHRMEAIFNVSHPNVLPVLASYCSSQEKLLVYEFQQHGSLHSFLLGNTRGEALFDWTSRLNAAAIIAESLAVMHRELQKHGIAHGNLKSSNILLNKSMQPCISEYGLENKEEESENGGNGNVDPFKKDVYGLGVILLELLTGKVVEENGMELIKWVESVVREEWAVEVFDMKLIAEGASEDRMLNLLEIAIKCVDKNAEARVTVSQVAVLINSIKEEEDKSLTFESSESQPRY